MKPKRLYGMQYHTRRLAEHVPVLFRWWIPAFLIAILANHVMHELSKR